jgi:hypothetical protein
MVFLQFAVGGQQSRIFFSGAGDNDLIGRIMMERLWQYR